MGEKRRDKGEGSVFQRKDGTWEAKYKSPKSSKPKYLYAKTEPEIKRKLRAYKIETIKNTPQEVEKITVETYMTRWLENVKFYELKPKSYDRLESTLENHVFPYVGDIQTAGLTSDDIQDMLNRLVKKGLSFSSVKKAYDAVNECFKEGMDKTPPEIFSNPCRGVSLPVKLKKSVRKTKNDIVYFSDKQADDICKACTAKYKTGKQIYRLGHAVIFLMYTGLRIAELLGLKWSDIDFDKRTATITDTVVQVKDRDEDAEKKYKLLRQDSTKTDSGQRIIYLNFKATDALNELKKINGKYDYVMCTASGRIVNPITFYKTYRDVLKSCGIKSCGLHSLRHTFASMLFKKGVDVKTVSELLGHSDVSVTYNTYIHLIKEQKQQVVALLDEI